MNKSLRAASLSILLGVVASFLIFVKPVMASVGCTGTSCVGHDASDMGCDDDQMQMGTAPPEVDNGRRDVILYYSDACQALWGYYFTTSDDSSGGFAVYSQAVYGGREAAVEIYPLAYQADIYTTMVQWSQSTKACFQWIPGEDPEPITKFDSGHPADCTKWY